MAEVSFSLQQVFEKAFGKTFDPRFAPVVNESNDTARPGLKRKEYGDVASSPYYGKDVELGREYYLPVTIRFPDESGNQGRLISFELPHPILTIRGRKTIIETPLVERRGTVKELINIQDYEIMIRGKIILKRKEFPEKKMQGLVSLYELNVPVYMSNPVTDIFLIRPDRSGSDQVVIRSFSIAEVRGAINVQEYEMSLVSDEPFNLIDLK